MASLLLIGLTALSMQVPQATLLGAVTDGGTGAPIGGAVVTLVDHERAVDTDAAGRYLLREVPAGPQHLTVRALGYAARTLHAIVPRSGALALDVALRPDPIRLQAVDVRPRVEVRGSEELDGSARPDRSVSIAAVRNHPLLAEPDVFQALGGGPVVLMPESPSGVHVRGGASDQTTYLLDGIPVLSPYHAAAVFSAWNPDALSRVDLFSASTSPVFVDALSGVVSGVTRAPGPTVAGQGSIGTNQVRAAVDGPLGAGEAGYLISWRSGFQGAVAPKDEPSYLHGEMGDLLGKLAARVLGGQLRLLAYTSEDEVDAAAVAEADPVGAPPRNVFEWEARSFGVSWEGARGPASLRVQAWSAGSDASSDWGLDAQRVSMRSDRRDEGALVSLDWGADATAAGTAPEATSPTGRSAAPVRRPPPRTTLSLRGQRIRTSYSTDALAADLLGSVWDGRAPLLAASFEHRRALGSALQLGAGTAVTRAAGGVHVGPRADLRWTPSDRWTLSASYARTHQFAQSLRNGESVAGNVFPADLYLTAGDYVPVARSDQGVLSAHLSPTPGVRASAQAWTRALYGLVLVAPGGSGHPFATGYIPTGSGNARGAAVELSAAGARYGVVAGYAWQRTRLEHRDGAYTPEHGTTHLLEGGVIAFPGATWQARLGASAALGRRTTGVSGALEWEACNLLDEGCEFGGSPTHAGEPLGGAVLPTYLRVDVGLRKHWHVAIAGRDASLALFGTVTNLLGRVNVLTYALDPLTGERAPVEMRPFAPLVVGLDWRF